jgi:putative methionine-R-sulfoxide reductase with GAF domain
VGELSFDALRQEKEFVEVIMTSTLEQDKPWKTDLARKAAQRRDQVQHEIEDVIRKTSSFEEALRLAVELISKRFARFSAVTAYVADGEDLAVHIAINRPVGPERVWTGGGPLADAAHGSSPTLVSDVSTSAGWAGVGLAKGSVAVCPIRTDAGLWAILEVWSEYRDAFTPPDVRMLTRVAGALARRTPTA